ncbi:MAG: hypothetical protein WD021_09520 [Rhodothermales bacterium]
MSNGISGYNSGGVNPYRQIERRGDLQPPARGDAAKIESSEASTRSTDVRIDLGSDLTEAEAGMIDRKFPTTERMRLLLYGPGRDPTSVDPGARGRQLDVRG